MHLDEMLLSLRPAKGAEYEALEFDGSYGIPPMVNAKAWGASKRRLLLVMESLDSYDIRSGRLFSSRVNKRTGNEENPFINGCVSILNTAEKFRAEYLGVNTLSEENLPGYTEEQLSLAVLNFNSMKFYNLKGHPYDHALRKQAERALAAIELLDPTEIIVFGDNAAHFLLKKSPWHEYLPFMRGTPHEVEVRGKNRLVTVTLSPEQLYSLTDDGEEDADDTSLADLLYYVGRHVAHALMRKNPHDLSEYTFERYKVIRSRKAFDAFYEKLIAHPLDEPIGFDVEAAGLEAYHNAFFTHQYAFSPDFAYLVPFYHPAVLDRIGTDDEVLSREDLSYFQKKLKVFWSSRKSRLICGQNLQFDFKLVRSLWDIPFIHHTAWTTEAGEQMLDENLANFNSVRWRVGSESVKTPQGNLAAILCAYGNDFYKTAVFSKAQRASFHKEDILAKGSPAARYACADAMSVLAIYHAQHERAKRVRITRKSTYDTWFHRHVTCQMSNTVHALSHMHQCGSSIDVPYLESLLEKDSPLHKFKAEVDAKLRARPSVQLATRMIADRSGIGRGAGLFGNAASSLKSLFSLTKPDHKLTLFFQVMNLEPVGKTATGQNQVGKAFYDAYRLLYPEVDMAEQVSKASKLLSTYVRGWLDKMAESKDSTVDQCLRPSFGFFDIVTGRLNSFKPSLQQVPSRGALAKYIKRAFVAKKGGLLFQYDYSANEVRFGAILAKDEAYAKVFRVGQELRQALIQEDNPEKIAAILSDLKTKGDIHLFSVFKFFNRWVAKKDPLRDAIKGVVFGLFYGKSARTLAKDLEKEAVARHKTIILKLEAEIKALEG